MQSVENKGFYFSGYKIANVTQVTKLKGVFPFLRTFSTDFSTGFVDNPSFSCNNAGLGSLWEKIHQVCVVTFDIIDRHSATL
uniref:Uncharacterized protein n=1 Tax=Candidatus Kentrum sp. TUN TaxID=2126343 RepID=A0A450ZPQ4_9GAMM|nr:MAG: hypothetical protein BECKTUN1418F_GA0071002_107210 [Candidatus Kentron sp. TUN]VFK60262.1 MAG: hypothetical protein BECKTUN1418D_GA0071000_11194 [Candidatus Kentron sp. TUN]VFK61712.1 MAG: hypothetical protein BECKTUN1418E_GA0071001_107010 [Candidatus Kentron sp. TUN]